MRLNLIPQFHEDASAGAAPQYVIEGQAIRKGIRTFRMFRCKRCAKASEAKYGIRADTG